ncbi:hypothetical protein ACVW16_007010 [Bradyrhizobium sp. USDA 4474]
MTFHYQQDETSEWLNYLQPEGLVVGANVLRETGVTPIRQTPLDTETAANALRLDPEAPREQDRLFELQDPWSFFEQVLGWPAKLVAGSPGGPAVDPALTVTVPEHETLLSPDCALLWNGAAPEGIPAQALVMLHPGLEAEGRNQFASGEWEATPHQRLERLLRESNVGVGILVTRNALRLIYAPRGETAGWLTWPLAALGRVEGRPMLAGLKLCLGRNAFFTGAPETRLRKLLEASREAQNAVSEKLSGQVLGALYELLRGLHRAAPNQIEAIAASDSHHLYEGLLTLLMRLVFLLYAEDRDLLPSSTDPHLKQLWDSGYSIKTLYARLLVDEALNPDTMDERRGGWGQLLAAFRLIHGGHPDWVTGRGGKLFDPEAFPFLEGRSSGSARTEAVILSVSDGTILRILHGLMTIEGRGLSGERIRERLSYRSLDVESIGSVYETVMGFTASRATERMIALRDEKKLPNFIGLDALLAEKPSERQKWLKERGIKLSAKQAKGVKDAHDVAALIEAFGSLVDERASPKAVPIGQGAPYLQPTEERRRSGSHYTPRSLTEPIVRHALEPAFARLGPEASPEAVLSLKVLDPACGSGAFLVEACRQIGARLEQAWNMYGAEKPKIPPDEDEALHAKRLVAQKCLYGVDKNPLAVDLARLSLWLATLAKDHEFTFLDHALKSGDSLVGLTRAEIAAAHWDASVPGLPLFRETIRQAIERAREGREAIRNASDDVRQEAQAARYQRVHDESEPARIVGDAIVAAFFTHDKPKTREDDRQRIENWIAGGVNVDWEKLKGKGAGFRVEFGWRPFHWEVEFPEVFARENPGFDAVVSNPPFLGGTSISARFGMSYFRYLEHFFAPAGHHCDLVGYFFRQSFKLLRLKGSFGMLATNTISQGDTREGALQPMISQGGSIYRATKRYAWPGEAAVVVSVVHMLKGETHLAPVLNGHKVERISAFLVEGLQDSAPRPLGQSLFYSLGCKIYGQGFLFDDGDSAASPLAEMEKVLRKNAANAARIHPYLGGDDLVRSPRHTGDRYIIQVSDLESEGALGDWPDLADIIRRKVLPERMKLGANPNNIPLRRRWWAYQAHRPELFRRLGAIERAICIPRVSPNVVATFVRTGPIFNEKIVVIPYDRASIFAVLQSRVHELWVRAFASTLKDDVNYSASDCLKNYALPLELQSVEPIGEAYFTSRSQVMTDNDEGLTKTYNRFHSSEERSSTIQTLRGLHDEMDRAVLHSYGWDDLAAELRPEFLTEETENDHAYQGRYFWPADQRDLVLARLLALNAERHAEEVVAGQTAAAQDGAGELDDAGAGPLFDGE